MKVKKSELLKVLAMVKPGLAKKEIVEQAAHFIFSGTDVATFNDQVCVIHPFKSDFPFSVKGDDFYKIIDRISEAEFDLSLVDDNIKIKSKSTNAALSVVVDEAASVIPMLDAVNQAMIGKNFWKPLPKDFTDGIYLCAFSASKDMSTGVRSCCAIKADAIFTTDNLRVSNYIMESTMDQVLIPARDASELVKYKVIEYGVSENWAHFRTEDGVIFNCKILKGDYPFDQLESVFTDDEVTMTFPAGMRDIVESIISLAEGSEDTSKSITVVVESGKIICKAEKERGWITKAIECDYEGEAFTFIINPVFFCQVMKHAREFVLLENRGMFISDNFYHVLQLPMAD